MKIFLNLIIVFLILSSCTKPISEEQSADLHMNTKNEISENWKLFFDAWVNGNADQSAAFFTNDGIHFRPSAYIDTGRTNIENVFSQILSSNKVEYCNQTTLEIEFLADKIIEYGTYQQKWAHVDFVVNGSYFAVWKREETEELKIHRLIFN